MRAQFNQSGGVNNTCFALQQNNTQFGIVGLDLVKQRGLTGLLRINQHDFYFILMN
ncbi:hypothetical protein MCHI_000012 [Candidatus Magnetoovum chiemensis]|nr:hypothetical protein MCHI_000012 [Candidatus Magnetoovum chiemensis]